MIVYARMDGDKVLCCSYAHELPRYGVKVGLTNYASAYCTGLLCARRLLKKLGLDGLYAGSDKVGAEYSVETIEGEKGAFRCYLDVGLARTSSGANIFGALKGAVDGGLAIPHNNSRFPGYDKEKKEYKPEEHRARILGHHVMAHMRSLKEEDEGAYNRQFSGYLKAGLGPDDIEKMYINAHTAIRADPSPNVSEKKEVKHKFLKRTKMPRKQKKERVRCKKALYLQQLQKELATAE